MLSRREWIAADASNAANMSTYDRMKATIRQSHKYMKYCNYPDFTSGCHESDLRPCSYCYAVYYCSVDHQRLQWPHHKSMCKEIKADVTKRQQLVRVGRVKVKTGSDNDANIATVHSDKK